MLIIRTASTGDILYRGYGFSRTGGGRLVVIETGGGLVGPLPHHIKHSPTGMSWGYDGSGPADLARSLLIHALGDAARCVVCGGTSEVVYDTVTDTQVSARFADRDQPGQGDDAASPRFSEPMRCPACENGWAVMSSTYQPFKFDVIAQLPEHGWTLSRAEVLAWFDQRRAATNPR